MKLKKIFIVLLLSIILVLPNSVFAKTKDCGSFSADNCPANQCLVENGVCVTGHIGQNFCSQKEVMDAMRVAGYFLFVARIFIPFIVIVFGSFDLFHAVTGGDEKALSSSAKKLAIRALIGFSIFLVPTIIHIVLSALNSYNAISDDANICQTCLLKPSECENGIPDDTNPYDDPLFVPKEETEEENNEEDHEE